MKQFLSTWAVVLVAFAALAVAPAYADVLVQTEKMELHNYTYKVNGVTIVCHYLKNPKLLSGKVNTGLSCVTVNDHPNLIVKFYEQDLCPDRSVHPDNPLF